MSIRDWLYHRHYWGIPHRPEGYDRVIQICYECGKQRDVQLDLKQSGEDDSNEEDNELHIA